MAHSAQGELKRGNGDKETRGQGDQERKAHGAEREEQLAGGSGQLTGLNIEYPISNFEFRMSNLSDSTTQELNGPKGLKR